MFGPPPGGPPMFQRRRLASAPVFKGDEVAAVVFVSPSEPNLAKSSR